MGVAKCDDVEVKRLFRNIVTTVAVVPELDEAIQTVVATQSEHRRIEAGAGRTCQLIHQGQRHCFVTASRVLENAKISACTVSGKVGSIAIPQWSMPIG